MSRELAKVISDYKLTIKWPQIKLIVVQCDQMAWWTTNGLRRNLLTFHLLILFELIFVFQVLKTHYDVIKLYILHMMTVIWNYSFSFTTIFNFSKENFFHNSPCWASRISQKIDSFNQNLKTLKLNVQIFGIKIRTDFGTVYPKIYHLPDKQWFTAWLTTVNRFSPSLTRFQSVFSLIQPILGKLNI